MRTTICDRCGRDCTHEDIEIVFDKELCSLCQRELSEWLEKKPERSEEISREFRRQGYKLTPVEDWGNTAYDSFESDDFNEVE